MAFTKVLIAIPATDYTGETVKHTVTKTNLKNQPELVEQGFKDGDVIDIIKPEEKAPKAETKTGKKETTKKETVSNKPSAEKTGEEKAAEIAEKFGVELVLENPANGEFFTNEHLALMSVGGKQSKLKYHNF